MSATQVGLPSQVQQRLNHLATIGIAAAVSELGHEYYACRLLNSRSGATPIEGYGSDPLAAIEEATAAAECRWSSVFDGQQGASSPGSGDTAVWP